MISDSTPSRAKDGRVGVAQVGAQMRQVHQLAAVEVAVRVDPAFEIAEGPDFVFAEELQLGNADAMLAGDHAAELARQRHDAFDRVVGRLQHRVVVGVHRDVGMHVAVAGMHVQGDEQAALEHVFVQRLDAVQHRAVGDAVEDFFEQRLKFLLPGNAQRMVLQLAEDAGGQRVPGLHRHRARRHRQRVPVARHGRRRRRRPGAVEIVEQALPARAHLGNGRLRLVAAVTDQLGLVQTRIAHVQRQFAGDEFGQRVAQLKLVADRQLDVEPLDAFAVIAHAWQRDDDVLIDLEGVGMPRDRRGTRAVEPEALACLGADGDEALAAAGIGHAHDVRGGAHYRRIVSADYVADQHHLGPAVAFCLGGVADGFHIALVEVFQAGELHAGGQPGAARFEVVGDLDDAGYGFAHPAEELEADGARHRRHLVQDPNRRGDQAVAAFLLHAGQTGEELVGDVLAQAGLAESAAGDGEELLAFDAAVVGEVLDAEGGGFLLVDLAQVVADAFDFQPAAVGIHHAPRGQVVQRRAPQHGLLAAGIHGDVAADAGGVGRGRVAGEDAAGFLGALHDAARDHAGAGVYRRIGARHAGQRGFGHRAPCRSASRC
jgi:hypothetical protein